MTVERDAARRGLVQLQYEVLHNLVIETTRLGIEVKNLKMRVESLTGRLEFNERRARALESVVVYKRARGAGKTAAAGSLPRPGQRGRPGARRRPSVSRQKPARVPASAAGVAGGGVDAAAAARPPAIMGRAAAAGDVGGGCRGGA